MHDISVRFFKYVFGSKFFDGLMLKNWSFEECFLICRRELIELQNRFLQGIPSNVSSDCTADQRSSKQAHDGTGS